MIQHWSVTVTRDGENIVTIETNGVSGRAPSPEDEETIRTAAHHLLEFIGDTARLRESHAALLAAAKGAFPVMTELMRSLPSTRPGYESQCKRLDALQAAIFQARDVEK